MKFVGIDPSYQGFGVVVLDENERHESFVWKFSPDSCGGSGVNQLVSVRSALVKLFSSIGEIGHVAIEGYAHGAKFGLTKSGELGGQVKIVMYDHLPMPVRYPTIVSPTQVKEYTTGSGGSAKDNMLLEVYKMWGVEFPHIASKLRNNAADAYALARIARDIYRGTADYPFQKKVVKKLTPHTEGGDVLKKWKALQT